LTSQEQFTVKPGTFANSGYFFRPVMSLNGFDSPETHFMKVAKPLRRKARQQLEKGD